jgi:class 3 adenylate cyclase/YHS domain-containing protein
MTDGADWTFAMIDLAGFTALTEAHGDDRAADLATDFADLARASLGPDDRFVKAIGDAVLLASPDPSAGLGLVERTLAACQGRAGYLLTRTALHHGSATQRSGDFFGSAVNLTARLAAHAAAGQVLATTSVAEVARASGLRVEDLGETTFKNISEPTRIHTVTLMPGPIVESVDPVCRMRVAHHNAAGFLRHEGAEFWFCSLECATQFAVGRR